MGATKGNVLLDPEDTNAWRFFPSFLAEALSIRESGAVSRVFFVSIDFFFREEWEDTENILDILIGVTTVFDTRRRRDRWIKQDKWQAVFQNLSTVIDLTIDMRVDQHTDTSNFTDSIGRIFTRSVFYHNGSILTATWSILRHLDGVFDSGF